MGFSAAGKFARSDVLAGTTHGRRESSMDSPALTDQIRLGRDLPVTRGTAMLPLVRPVVLWSALLSTLGPLTASAQVRKPVPGQPYQYWDIEDVDGGARRVYFRNDSPDPITITQLVIQRCDNTRQACGTYPANVVVAPGKTVMPFKIERLDKKLGWQFSYSFRTTGPQTATVGAPQSITTTGAPGGRSTSR